MPRKPAKKIELRKSKGRDDVDKVRPFLADSQCGPLNTEDDGDSDDDGILDDESLPEADFAAMKQKPRKS